MDERINSEHFNLVIIYLSPVGERGGGFWRGNQMVFMGNGGGLDYTLIQSIRGGDC